MLLVSHSKEGETWEPNRTENLAQIAQLIFF